MGLIVPILCGLLTPNNANAIDDVALQVLIKLATNFVADFKKHLSKLSANEQQDFQTSMRLSVAKQQQLQQQMQQQQESQSGAKSTTLKLDFSKYN